MGSNEVSFARPLASQLISWEQKINSMKNVFESWLVLLVLRNFILQQSKLTKPLKAAVIVEGVGFPLFLYFKIYYQKVLPNEMSNTQLQSCRLGTTTKAKCSHKFHKLSLNVSLKYRLKNASHFLSFLLFHDCKVRVS